MKFARWMRRKPTTHYWVNGFGPFDTPEERDEMHSLLKEVAEHNRRFLVNLAKRQRVQL